MLPEWIEELEEHKVWAQVATVAIDHMLYRETGFLPAMDLLVWDAEFEAKHGIAISHYTSK